jgi:hypothetical protein
VTFRLGTEKSSTFFYSVCTTFFIYLSGPEISLEAQTFDVPLVAGADYSDDHPQGGKNASEYPSNFVGGKVTFCFALTPCLFYRIMERLTKVISAWEASTLEKSHPDSLLIAIWNIYI